MTNSLSGLWAYCDDHDPLFAESALQDWPAEAFQRLRALGLLQPAASATVAPCPHCADGHCEEVVCLRHAGGAAQHFIHCPAHLRVPVSVDSLRQWTIQFPQLVILLAKAISAIGHIKELIPNMLWRLGKVQWKEAKREVLFARFTSEGRTLVVKRVETYARPIVFVADAMPTDLPWQRKWPSLVSLSHIADLTDAGFELDAIQLASMVAEADDQAAQSESQSLTLERLVDLTKREVRTALRNQLTEDAIVQAYRDHGSTKNRNRT